MNATTVVLGLALAAFAVPLVFLPGRPVHDMVGMAAVVDGDTLFLNRQRVRLFGVDAPEHDQTCTLSNGTKWQCGVAATMKLADLIRDQNIVCQRQDIDVYGRPVAICYAGNTDVNAELVLAGMATAYKKYSWRYVPEEQAARWMKRGIWDGQFEPPAAYRARRAAR